MPAKLIRRIGFDRPNMNRTPTSSIPLISTSLELPVANPARLRTTGCPIGRVAASFFFLLLGIACLQPLPAQEQVPNLKKDRPAKPVRPYIIEFKGEIDWQLSKYFRSRLEQAKSAGADLIIVEIDSPGGLKSESLSLAEMLRDVDWAYTVAFVPREALSGAALMAFGCDELIIGELARFGDIGIIHYDPQLFAFRFAPAKIQSVLVRQARDLAASKGRSPELAEAMIDKDFLVYQKKNNGSIDFRGSAADEEPPGEGWQLVPETKKGFLTLNGVRAKELQLATGFATDRETAAKEIGFDLSTTRVLKRTATDSIVYYLNHPLGAGLLIVIGLIAFFSEISAPGIGVGGLIAGLCAMLFFWSRFLGGTSTWLEIVLFAAGIIFLLMELFVIPGWGISGIMGLFLTVSSVFMASQDFVVPTNERQWNQFLTSTLMLLCSGTVFAIGAAFIVKYLGYIPIFSQLMLAPPDEQEFTDELKSKKPGRVEHPDISIGDWGRSESLLRPAGRAIFNGRSFDVVSDGEFIEPGRQVKVLDIQGNRILVSAIEDPLDDTNTV